MPRFHSIFWLASGCLFLSSGWAARGQTTEISHAERFASPRERLERAEKKADALLEKNPADAKALADRGEARLRLGRREEALGDFEEAARIEPSSADIQTGLAYALLVSGFQERALAAARAALALNPNHSGAHYYAGLLQDASDPKEAIRHLEQAVALDPERDEIRFDLLALYRRTGDAARAGLQARLLRAILPPQDARLLYTEGLMAADRGALAAAADFFRRAVDANPRMISARFDLGRALVQLARWPEAVKVYESLARERPDSQDAAYFHALALQNSGRVPEAEREARRAIELGPDSADARTLLGIVLAGRGEHGEALKVLEEAARLDARSYDAQFYLGRTRYALRDLAGAAAALRAAAEVRPEEPEARFFLATALESLGDAKAAEEQYRELVRMLPQDARGYTGLGNFQAKHGQLQEASTALRRAHELDPAGFEATLALGRTLARLGQLEEALGLLREAARMMPESAEAHYQLGLALQRTGKPEEAKKEFATVDRLNREYRSRSGGMEAPPEPPKP